MTEPPLLRVSELTAGYSRPVVGPVSLTLNRGDRLGLLGQNGTGKSTLLRAIGNAARIFSGRIERSPGLRIAHLDQRPVRLPEMPITGRELLRIAGAAAGDAPPRLQSILGRRIDRLSGGQYQLLWIWSALAATVDLILLDEPTNHLDAPHRTALVEILANRQADRALILVSHERAFLEQVCSRVLDVGDGRSADA